MSDVNRVERLWLQYREAVIPPDAPSVQLTECRRAFYAGAHAFFTETLVLIDPSAGPTDEDVRKLGLMQAELNRFKDSVNATTREGRPRRRKTHHAGNCKLDQSYRWIDCHK